jgi:hypothetical protein
MMAFPPAFSSVDDEDPVAPDDRAVLVDDANPVAVTVECDADLGPILLHRGDQVLEVLGNRRVGMMVGEGSITLAEQPSSLDAQPLEQLRGDQ